MPDPSRAQTSRQMNEMTLKAVMYITEKNYTKIISKLYQNYTKSIRHEVEIYLYLCFIFVPTTEFAKH